MKTCVAYIVIGLIYLFLTASLAAEANATAPEDLCSAARTAIKDAEKIRGLRIKNPVPCLVSDRKKIRNYVVQVVKQELPAERLEYEEFIYKALGMIPQNYNYQEAVIELYTSQIGGYYDPQRNHFVMADWIPLDLQYPVAVHELTHALQDQHYNLKNFTDSKALTTDNLLARAALVEGDATAVMLDYTARSHPGTDKTKMGDEQILLDKNLFSVGIGDQDDPANKAIVALMVFPYSAGLKFAQSLIRNGGYKALDRAFKTPPKTTREVLQPDLYPLEPNKILSIKPRAFELADGEKIIFSDVLGQFFLSIWLEQLGLAEAQAELLARSWAGDRIALVETTNSQRYVKWIIELSKKEAELQLANLINTNAKLKNLASMDCSSGYCIITLK